MHDSELAVCGTLQVRMCATIDMRSRGRLSDAAVRAQRMH